LDEDVVMAPELNPVAVLGDTDEASSEYDADVFEENLDEIEAEVVELEQAAI
jgi:hypothetical protein|tara:strand:+ start:1269 stop:1424 length:156 start_codon:yes stop_codon:yes gene_type:complete